jgi:hypothetical protein
MPFKSPAMAMGNPFCNVRWETSAFVSARPLKVSTAGADSKVGSPSPRSPICGEERKRSNVSHVSQRSHHHYYHHYVVCTYQLSHVAVNSTEIGEGSKGGGRLLEEEERKASVVTSQETKIVNVIAQIVTYIGNKEGHESEFHHLGLLEKFCR